MIMFQLQIREKYIVSKERIYYVITRLHKKNNW